MARHKLGLVSDFHPEGYNLPIRASAAGGMICELALRLASTEINDLERRMRFRTCHHCGESISFCNINF